MLKAANTIAAADRGKHRIPSIDQGYWSDRYDSPLLDCRFDRIRIVPIPCDCIDETGEIRMKLQAKIFEGIRVFSLFLTRVPIWLI